MRYPGAQVFYFDKGYSSFVVAHACGAAYYDIGTNQSIAFCPLAQVNEEGEREWALDWLEGTLFLQGVTITPGQRVVSQSCFPWCVSAILLSGSERGRQHDRLQRQSV